MVDQTAYENKLRKQYYRCGCWNTILAYVIGGPLGILLLGILLYLANRGGRGDDAATDPMLPPAVRCERL